MLKNLFVIFNFIVLISICPQISQAAIGDVDSDFGISGSVTMSETDVSILTRGVLVDSLNRIWVYGSTSASGTTKPIIYRFMSDGTLDISFSDDGKFEFGDVTGLSGVNCYGNSAKILSDNSMVLLIQDTSGAPLTYYLAKVTDDGELDTTFATDGIGNYDSADAISENAVGLVVTENDDIIVAGYTITYLFITGIDGNTGEIISSFGDIATGTTISDMPLHTHDSVTARDIAIDSNGKIYVVGEVYEAGESSFFIIRFLSTGEIDSGTFNTGITPGYKITPWVVGIEQPVTALVDKDDLLTMALITDNGADNSSTLMRFEDDSSFDPDFTGGFFEVDIAVGSDQVGDMAINSNGSIYIANQCPAPDDVCLVRITASGALDTDFGSTGAVNVLSTPALNEEPTGIALNSVGRIIVLSSVATADTSFVLSQFLAEQSDLVITLEATQTELLTTETASMTLTIENQGTHTASDVTFSASTDGAVTLSNLSDTCVETASQGEFQCSLSSSLAPGDSHTVTFDYTNFAVTTLNLEVSVETASDDSDFSNNTTSLLFTLETPSDTGDDDDDDDDDVGTTGDDDDDTAGDDDSTSQGTGGCQLQSHGKNFYHSWILMIPIILVFMLQRRRI